jgi:hypothetical protein
MSDPVVPIVPELEPQPGDVLLERLNRWYAEFAASGGPPVAVALVIMNDRGHMVTRYRTIDLAAAPGADGFLTLGGAMLVQRGLNGE